MSNIYLRQAREEDLPKVLDIISGAKKTLRDRGVDQWQTGYPDEAILKQDLKDGINYVMLLDGEVVGTAALQQDNDPNYIDLQGGNWADDSHENFSVIHRIAVEPGHQGQHLSAALIRQLLTTSYARGFSDVRIDTHPDNLVMQHVITSNGFIEKGLISMEEDEGARKAYQIILH
ncbi:GNAT family N-acetyltransferase [Companilactobacillus mishanensis]|uniref:GNAT family N-acetyltransferase n=1 Tax=Companilactobacillus mishanensis TaxID=2486008 RepID=A0ABW9P7P4_9LACO|nr:GNAT family N-acetyltransferase [Companilactobacillus mishanensis]MQS45289.1 GNAT family N-acetyltransferase [Companilactobacillus mishanensis]MQS90027.1 GNAT family N-acetyltransferase [Companilactobacillus mishanensis]